MIFFCLCNVRKEMKCSEDFEILHEIFYNTSRKSENHKQRRWTMIALRNFIFYFWSNIELTWHEYSFMSQITNYKEKM